MADRAGAGMTPELLARVRLLMPLLPRPRCAPVAALGGRGRPGPRRPRRDLDDALDRLAALAPEPEEPPGALALFDPDDLLAPVAGWAAEVVAFPDLRPPGVPTWARPSPAD